MTEKTKVTKKGKDGKYYVTKEGYEWLATKVDPKDKIKWFGEDVKK